MEPMQISSSSSTESYYEALRSYLADYKGHTRLYRLLVLADKQLRLKYDALRLCLDISKAEKKLGFYQEAVKVLKRQFHDQPQNCPIPNLGVDQDFERIVAQEYKNEVKKKEQEIQQLQKSMLRDSMRLAFNDLGKIHYSYGFMQEAIKSWVKSHDFSNDQEDHFMMAFQIAQASYEGGIIHALVKYNGEADARNKGKNSQITSQIRILEPMASLITENYRLASQRFLSVSVTEVASLNQYLTQTDLAYYIILTSLHSLTRSEIKSMILSASSYSSIMEAAPAAQDLIENYLNGRYSDFQKQLHQVALHFRFDPFIGHRIQSIIGEIRKKALIQYVTPYKVIDMREIAKAFDISIEKIEQEIAELIVNKKIQAKIDSNSKLLYSRKDNETLNSYKQTAALGRLFIQETENALLRVNAMKKQLILKQKGSGQDPRRALNAAINNNDSSADVYMEGQEDFSGRD